MRLVYSNLSVTILFFLLNLVVWSNLADGSKPVVKHPNIITEDKKVDHNANEEQYHGASDDNQKNIDDQKDDQNDDTDDRNDDTDDQKENIDDQKDDTEDQKHEKDDIDDQKNEEDDIDDQKNEEDTDNQNYDDKDPESYAIDDEQKWMKEHYEHDRMWHAEHDGRVGGQSLNEKDSLNINKTKIFLFMRSISNGHETLDVSSADSIKNCSFDHSLETYIIVPDYGMNPFNPNYVKLKTKLLVKKDANVMIIAWDGGSGRNNQSLYITALDFLPKIGLQMAEFLHTLRAVKSLDYTTLHFIGDGLGAHIAGVTGEKYTDGSISSITGLDPAGINFSPEKNAGRLSKDDASHVMVIHTNGCKNPKPPNFFYCYGAYFELGSTDFFPNGGEFQNMCDKKHQGKATKGRKLFCDHDAALLYYLNSMDISLSDTVFLARRAPDYNHFRLNPADCGPVPQYLGYYADTRSPGRYYLNVSSHIPYGVKDPACSTAVSSNLAYATEVTAFCFIFIALIILVLVPVLVCIRRRNKNKEKHRNITSESENICRTASPNVSSLLDIESAAGENRNTGGTSNTNANLTFDEVISEAGIFDSNGRLLDDPDNLLSEQNTDDTSLATIGTNCGNTPSTLDSTGVTKDLLV